MASHRTKRHRFFIDRLQGRLLGVTLLYFGTAAVIFTAALFAPFMLQMSANAESPDTRSAITAEFLALHSRFWPVILIAFVLLTAHSVFISHRIAGPLFRFRRVFTEMKDGNLVPLSAIREQDLLAREANDLNSMLASMRHRIAGIVEEQRFSQEQLDHLKRAMRANDPDETAAHLNSLEEGLEALRERLADFKLKRD